MSAYRLIGDAFSEYYFERVLFQDAKLAPYLRLAADDLRSAQRLVREARKTLALRANAASTESQLLRPLSEVLGWIVSEDHPLVETVHGEADGGLLLTTPAGTIWARAFPAAPNTNFEATPQGLHRRFALSTSIVRVLDATATPYAIVLNRQELRIVRRAEGGANSAIAFDLDALAAHDENSERGWRLLFGLLRADSLLEPLVLDRVVALGRREMVGVGNALGQQVQDALALFVRGLYANPANLERLPRAGDEVGLATVHGEALRILYRCLFALYAEARGLVPVDLPIYRESYALTSVTDAPVAGAAARLRASFTLLRRGADLGNGERVPAFGGALFSTDAAPLVESLVWNDASIAAMLGRLTRIEGRHGSGQMPVSYRELDEERLGSIYEGLLELRLSLADKPMERIVVQGRELVIDPLLLHDLTGYESTVATADTQSEAAIELTDETDDAQPSGDGAEIASGEEPIDAGSSTNGDARVATRRRSVTRLETIPVGTPYLASSSGRKETASYYTARDLVDFLVRETIDPRAEHAEPAAILRLRVIDPAMGSGHFLIGAMRRLADHLMAAYRRVAERDPTDDAGLETLPLYIQRAWEDERELLALCRQLVAVHCLYGVDKNPLAVDLARVALWLATAAADHPLSFLDHRLRCGDSLLGLTVAQIVAIPATASAQPGRKAKTKQYELLTIEGDVVDEIALERAVQRSLLTAFNVLRGFLAIVDDNAEPFELKRERADAVRAALEPLRTLHAARVGQLLYGVESGGSGPFLQALRTFSRLGYLHPADRVALTTLVERADLDRAFCWELEFPEAFYRSRDDGEVVRREDAGFDVVVGNPPWDKLKIEQRAFYARYDPLILDYQGHGADRRIRGIDATNPHAAIAFKRAVGELSQYVQALSGAESFSWQSFRIDGRRTGGDADTFKFFVERDWSIARHGGAVGLVLPAAFTSGDGTTGLRHLLFGQSKLQSLFVFENRRKLFPIDSRFKFQTVVFERGGVTTTFEAAFWQHETDFLRESRAQRAGKTLSLSAGDIRRASPERLAILEVRTARDLQIVQRMLSVASSLSTVAAQWGATFGRELDMSQDRRLFRTREQLEADGARRVGDAYLGTHGTTYLPLREGRMVQAFDANAKRYRSGEGRSAEWDENGWPKSSIKPHYWVPLEELDPILRAASRRLYWADVTGATNERTSMAAVVEAPCISGHSLSAMYIPQNAGSLFVIAQSVFNSFTFDWYMRLSVAQHMSQNFIAPAPFVKTIPYAELEKSVAAVCSPTIEYVQRADLRATLDAAVALAYELSYGDFAHILAGFPLIDRGEPPLEGEVRSTITRDLALAAYCRLAGEHDPEHADRVRVARAGGALGYVATPLRMQLPHAVRRPR